MPSWWKRRTSAASIPRQVGPPTGEKIFISYERRSAATARALHRALTEDGFRVWLDTEDLRAADRWALTIDRALAESDQLVLLLTQDAAQSVEVFNEWFYVYQHHKPIVVVRLDDTEPHYQLLPFQRIEWRGRPDTALDNLAARIARALRSAFAWPDTDPVARAVVTSTAAPSRSVTGALAALEEALRYPERPVALSPAQLHDIYRHPAQDLRDYWLSCYARWCQPQYQLDRLFVNLTLVLDEGTGSPDRWITPPSTKESNDLGEILTGSDSFAFVLLGAPGSGKTTLLHRLEMDVARTGILEPTNAIVPFGVSLAEYGLSTADDPISPLDWLEQRWANRNPGLAGLRGYLDAGRVLLLVDGLNELPHFDQSDLRRRVDSWRAFLYERIRDVPGNRAVFTCRTLDYGAMLSSKDVGVPHIRLEPMAREQVLAYVGRHIPDHADLVRSALLRDDRTLSFYRTPYMLRLLVSQVRAVGTVPTGRVDAFAAMVRELLRREILAGNQRLTNPEMIADRDQRQLHDGAADPRWLPDRGHFIPALTRLAYQMQQAKSGEDKGAVVVDYDTALVLLNGLARLAEESLKVGLDTGILDEHEQAIGFFHQLLQEFFAARQLAAATDLSHLRVPVTTDEVRPTLPNLLGELSPGEPMPPLPTTGWEETAVMAAAITTKPDAFVARILAVNAALAARCIATPDVGVSDDTRRAVADALLAGIANPRHDVRARIAEGDVLGHIADPRLDRIGNALLPEFVRITGGEHRIGADGSAYPLERPVHQVTLPAFDIATRPVTNAEYQRFIDAGGYEHTRWWATDNARRWLQADDVLDLIAQEWAVRRDNLRRRPDLPVDLLRTGTATLHQAVSMVKLTTMDDAAVRDALQHSYGRSLVRFPALWHDSRFNQPGQPVVGVSIFEAEAYCRWLSAATGQHLRLPTEYEWEAAAHVAGTTFPHGQSLQPWDANTFELHIRTTTPVGIFPDSVSPSGCYDMAGNVFEWTASTYAPYPYPTDAAISDDLATVRICRGGSWRHHQVRARSAYRGRGKAYVRNDDLGFRLARTP